jgi:hypothetical protein
VTAATSVEFYSAGSDFGIRRIGMLSRALSLATVMLLIGCFTTVQAQAQNLEAGKSPSQIFAGTCSACHKSPRGLLKTVPAGSLPGFLRQHYTTSSDMASLLSAFLVSNGAADTRYVGTQPKQDKDAKSEAKPTAPPEQFDRHGRRLHAPGPSQEAARPDAPSQQAAKPGADMPQPETARQGRKRLARPAEEAPDAAKPAADGHAPAQTASERGPDGRKSTAKQRLSKRGRAGTEELPKTDASKTDTPKTDAAKSDTGKDEVSKGEPVKEDKPQSDTIKFDYRPEGVKSPGEGKSEAARSESPRQTGSETPALRADPVPPVTPAPQTSAAAPSAASGGTPEPAAGPSPAAASSPAQTTASVPAPPPAVAPAGPPAPPISQ